MRYELATDADDVEIRRLLRENPMEGSIRVSLETEPSHRVAAAVQGDRHQVIVARDEESGRVVGIAGRSLLEGWVNGDAREIGYLSQLRVDRAHRRRALRWTEGAALFRALHADRRVPFYVTTILADNLPARRLLERGLPELPVYRRREEIVTLVLPAVRPVRPRGESRPVTPAAASDLAGIVACLERNGRRFNFTPRWTAEHLLSEERTRGLRLEDFHVVRREGRIVGCLALWHQAFKQAVVRGYDRRLGALRPVWNLLGSLHGRPRLPRPGEALRSAFLSHLAVDDDDETVLLALLHAAHADAVARPIDYLHLGLARRHPAFEAVRARFPAREYVSLLYLVHLAGESEATDAVDDRVAHPEVAIL